MAEIRKLILKKLFSGIRGRKEHYRGMPDDIIYVTRRLHDHVITFKTNELIGRYLYSRGQWQRDDLEKVLGFLEHHSCIKKEKNVAVDLGANIGTETIYLLLNKKFKKVVAIEPDPENVKLLKRNVADNGFEDEVVIVDKAISEKPEKLKLFLHPYNSGAHSIIENPAESLDYIEVEGVPLKNLFEEHSIASQDVGFFWIDLEGYEYEAMCQVVDVCSPTPPVFVEFNPSAYGKQKTDEFIELIKFNYKNYYVFGDGKKLEMLKTENFMGSEYHNLLLLNAS